MKDLMLRVEARHPRHATQAGQHRSHNEFAATGKQYTPLDRQALVGGMFAMSLRNGWQNSPSRLHPKQRT